MQVRSLVLCFVNPPPDHVCLFSMKPTRKKSTERFIYHIRRYDVYICIVLSIINKKLGCVIGCVCVAVQLRQELDTRAEALISHGCFLAKSH